MQRFKDIFQIFSVRERELGCDLALTGLIQQLKVKKSASKNQNRRKDQPSLYRYSRVALVTVAQTAPENASGK